MKIRILPTVVAALVALSACGGSSSDDATSATVAADATADATTEAPAATDEADTVMITNSRFDNVELRVAPGTTVTFVNNDPFAHTVTSRDDSPTEFDSGNFGEGETFEFTFDDPGEYAYFCQIHPTMRAVVIVG